MFGHKREFEYIKRNIDNLWNNISMLYADFRQTKVLFKEDRHGTIRPKVDMLDEQINDSEVAFWNVLDGFQKRIEKLEKVNEGNKNPTNKEN